MAFLFSHGESISLSRHKGFIYPESYTITTWNDHDYYLEEA
jgi:hypothetical protein